MKSYLVHNISELPWLEKLPKHWSCFSLWAVTKLRNEKNPGNLEMLSVYLHQGVIPYPDDVKAVHSPSEDLSNYQVVRPGDLVLNNQQAWRGSVGVSKLAGIISPAYLVFKLSNSLDSTYANYLFRAPHMVDQFVLASRGVGSIQRQIHFPSVRMVIVPIPPLNEQQRIGKFLDDKLADIDRYIAEKERLIELLQEQKTAIINQAVTKGISPQARMMNSNLGMVGSYPEHWSQLPLKRTVKTKITDGPHETPELLDEGYDFVSAEAMQNGKIVFEKRRGFISKEAHERFCKKLRPQRDDVFFCKSGATTGKVAIVETDKEFSVWSPLALIRVDKRKVLPEYMFLTLQAGYLQFQMKEIWSYGTQPNIAMSEIERLIVLLPPIEEQSSILVTLRNDLAPLDLSVSQTEAQIEIMQEYRTSLIVETVTGKIDVR